MNVLIYLVPMAVGLGLIGLFAFLWALKSGQYEDIEGAALRVLSDDDAPAHERLAPSASDLAPPAAANKE
jgi:cbb3-type cytochrome oxidase maturation protein